MTAREASQFIGREIMYTTKDGFIIPVVVKDVKVSYGRNRYLLTPKDGFGEVWVETDIPQMSIMDVKETSHTNWDIEK